MTETQFLESTVFFYFQSVASRYVCCSLRAGYHVLFRRTLTRSSQLMLCWKGAHNSMAPNIWEEGAPWLIVLFFKVLTTKG